MRNCCVCKALYSPLDNRSFHTFPKDADLRKKWMGILGVTEPINLRTQFVCSDHFNDNCYYDCDEDHNPKRLRKGALPKKATDSVENQTNFPLPKDSCDKYIVITPLVTVDKDSSDLAVDFSVSSLPRSSPPQSLDSRTQFNETETEAELPPLTWNVNAKKRKSSPPSGIWRKRFKFMDGDNVEYITRRDFSSHEAWNKFVRYKERESHAAVLYDDSGSGTTRNMLPIDVNIDQDIMLCRICLATDCKMYSMWKYELVEPFKQLTGLKIKEGDGLPTMLCFECAHRLKDCKKFREKCLRADTLMLEMSNYKTLTLKSLSMINREQYHLKSTLKTSIQNYSVLDDEYLNIKKEDTTPYFQEDYMPIEVNIKHEYPKDNVSRSEEFTNKVTVVNEDNIEFTEYEALNNESDDTYDSDVQGSSNTKKTKSQNETEKIMIVDENAILQNKKIEIGDDSATSSDELVINDIKNRTTNQAASTSIKKNIKVSEKAIVNSKNIEIEDDSASSSDELVISDIKNRITTKAASTTKAKANNNTKAIKKIVMVRKKKVKKKLNGNKRPTPNAGFDEKFTTTDLTMEEQIEQITKRQETKNYRLANFQCEKCFRGFIDKKAYETHLIRHSNVSGPLECEICRLHFKTRKQLKDHLNKHKQLYSCNLCDYKNTRKNSAVAHFKWHKGTRYACPHCPEVFQKHTTYFSHIRLKHPSDFTCQLCGYSFVSEKGVEKHKSLSHRFEESQQIPDDGPTCDSCNIKFKSTEAYETHLQVSAKHTTLDDSNSRRNDCHQWNGNTNKRRRERIGPIICEQCGEELPSARTYHNHFRVEHPGVNRTRYPSNSKACMCEICGKLFNCQAVLNDHTMQHLGHTFKCEVCEKVLSSKQGLANHRKQHSPHRPRSQCAICGKYFSNQPNMRRHLLIHTGLKPFKCELCEKAFTSKSEKQLHITYVHLKKPWPKRDRAKKKGIRKETPQQDY